MSEEQKAIKRLENATTNYSLDSEDLHYAKILYYLIINLQQENQELKDRIDKANWWLEEMLKQTKNDETKAIIYGTLDLLLKEIKNDI